MTKNNHKWIRITIYGYFMLRYTMKNNIMYIRKTENNKATQYDFMYVKRERNREFKCEKKAEGWL